MAFGLGVLLEGVGDADGLSVEELSVHALNRSVGALETKKTSDQSRWGEEEERKIRETVTEEAGEGERREE